MQVGARLFNPWIEHTTEEQFRNYPRSSSDGSKRVKLGSIKAKTDNRSLARRSFYKNASSSASLLFNRNIEFLVQGLGSIGLQLETRRILVLSGFPKKCNVSAMLSKCAGGPLEKLVLHRNREVPALELHFVNPEEAQNFFLYGQNSLFKLCGQQLSLEWANEVNTRDISSVHPQITAELSEQIKRGARRVLLFVKNSSKKPKSNHASYPNPETNYSSDFKVSSVYNDFASFGHIIEITPVISKKLSFCIHFTDIREAIAVKTHCSSQGTRLADKYKDWNIYFGKDPTDRPFCCS